MSSSVRQSPRTRKQAEIYNVGREEASSGRSRSTATRGTKRSRSSSRAASPSSRSSSSKRTKRSPASSASKKSSSSNSKAKSSKSTSTKRSQAAKKAATTRGRGVGSRVKKPNPRISQIPYRADADTSPKETNTPQHNPRTEQKRMSHISSKRKRQAQHIEESYEKKGMGSKKAKAIAMATVNKQRAQSGEAKSSSE